MNKKIIIGVVIVALLVIATLIVAKTINQKTEPVQAPAIGNGDIPKGKLITGSALETFSGTITSVDTGCFSDKICSVTVDGKKVILVKGGRGLPPDTLVGKLIGVDSIDALAKQVGGHANVYAGITPEGDYSIYGNVHYYVEVINAQK